MYIIYVNVLTNYKFRYFEHRFQITSHIISQSNETVIITHEADQLSIGKCTTPLNRTYVNCGLQTKKCCRDVD